MADSCPSTEAFVSLATNDFYATGALVLGKSIRDAGTSRKLALLVTAGVSMGMREALLKVWDELVEVEEIDSGDAESLALLSRPELGITFTKLAVWTLTQYTKCVYLDADTLVLQHVDELFSREELSAAPDIGWPDCFNSGVFVFRPSQDTFRKLMELANQMGSFDGGDQGVLNSFWNKWATEDIKHHLPFIYNMTSNASYGYAPAFCRFRDNIKIIHFIGPVKPWHHKYLSDLDTVILQPGSYGSQHSNQDFIRWWWQVYSSLTSLLPGDKDIQLHHSSSQQMSPASPITSTHQPPLPPPPQPSHLCHHTSVVSSPFPISPSTSHRTSGQSSNWTHGSISDGYCDDGGNSSSGSSSSNGTVSSSNYILSSYQHSVTPLDSASQLTAPGIASGHATPSPSLDPSCSSRSSLQPVSILSHENVHSHISLSFYASSIFDQMASLVDTEPRTYYIEDLRSEVEEDDPNSPEHYSSQSLTSGSHVSLPTFLTPSSSAIFKHLPLLRQDDYPLGGYENPQPPSCMLYRSASSGSCGGGTRSPSPLPHFTEYDEYNETPIPHDVVASPTTPVAYPAEGGGLNKGLVGGERACSDSVQPLICRSLSSPSPPLSPSLSSLSYPSSSCPLKDIESSVLSSQIMVESAHPGSGTFSHRREFEAGFVDYHGRDSFSNIFAHMKLSMGEDQQGDVTTGDSLKSTSASSLRSRGSSIRSRDSSGAAVDDDLPTKDHSEEEASKSYSTATVGKSASHSSQSAKSASPASHPKAPLPTAKGSAASKSSIKKT